MCGGPLDISGTPEIVDRLSQGVCVILILTAQQGVHRIFTSNSDFASHLMSETGTDVCVYGI